MKRYVVSGDLGLILSGTGLPKGFFSKLGIGDGYSHLLQKTRDDLRAVLSSVFPSLEYLDEHFLAKGFNEKMEQQRKNGLAVVSLDRIYADPSLRSEDGHYWLDVTRMYDAAGKSTLRGRLHGKFCHLAPAQMVASICLDMRNKGFGEAALADDVIFSGGSIINTAREFEKNGIIVTHVVSCVAIDSGVKALAEAGIRVDSVANYKDVEDQICERDFICGMPQAGVLMMEGDRIIKRPYVMPFGDPIKRASIPPALAIPVSHRLLEISAALWKGLEHIAGRQILGSDLPEAIALIPPDKPFVSSIMENAAMLIGMSNTPAFRFAAPACATL